MFSWFNLNRMESSIVFKLTSFFSILFLSLGRGDTLRKSNRVFELAGDLLAEHEELSRFATPSREGVHIALLAAKSLGLLKTRDTRDDDTFFLVGHRSDVASRCHTVEGFNLALQQTLLLCCLEFEDLRSIFILGSGGSCWSSGNHMR